MMKTGMLMALAMVVTMVIATIMMMTIKITSRDPLQSVLMVKTVKLITLKIAMVVTLVMAMIMMIMKAIQRL